MSRQLKLFILVFKGNIFMSIFKVHTSNKFHFLNYNIQIMYPGTYTKYVGITDLKTIGLSA